MTDNAVKLRSIFYGGGFLTASLYGFTSYSHACEGRLLTMLLQFAVTGLLALLCLEYICELQNSENELLTNFRQYSDIYEADADEKVSEALKSFFDLDDEPNNLLINENICAKLNGKIYSLSNIDAYCNGGKHFSGLVLSAPIEMSSKHILAAGKQNAMSVVNTKEFIYSDTPNSIAVFNSKDSEHCKIPDDLLKIINNLQADLNTESIFCSIRNNMLQIVIKTNKSYKDSASAIYGVMCNLSLRSASKGENHEQIKVSEKVRQIEKYK